MKTADEVFESLNGFDEIAIEKAFAEVTSLKDKPMTFLRALVFTEKRREKLGDKEAKQYAMELPVKELTAYFADKADIEAGEA